MSNDINIYDNNILLEKIKLENSYLKSNNLLLTLEKKKLKIIEFIMKSENDIIFSIENFINKITINENQNYVIDDIDNNCKIQFIPMINKNIKKEYINDNKPIIHNLLNNIKPIINNKIFINDLFIKAALHKHIKKT